MALRRVRGEGGAVSVFDVGGPSGPSQGQFDKMVAAGRLTPVEAPKPAPKPEPAPEPAPEPEPVSEPEATATSDDETTEETEEVPPKRKPGRPRKKTADS